MQHTCDVWEDVGDKRMCLMRASHAREPALAMRVLHKRARGKQSQLSKLSKLCQAQRPCQALRTSPTGNESPHYGEPSSNGKFVKRAP